MNVRLHRASRWHPSGQPSSVVATNVTIPRTSLGHFSTFSAVSDGHAVKRCWPNGEVISWALLLDSVNLDSVRPLGPLLPRPGIPQTKPLWHPLSSPGQLAMENGDLPSRKPLRYHFTPPYNGSYCQRIRVDEQAHGDSSLFSAIRNRRGCEKIGTGTLGEPLLLGFPDVGREPVPFFHSRSLTTTIRQQVGS